MSPTSTLVCWRQVRLPQLATQVRHFRVSCQEFLALLLSRRGLERCNDTATNTCGLFDPSSGELFDIDESELNLRQTV